MTKKKEKTKSKKNKTKYLIAVRAADGNAIFEFDTLEDRSGFIDDIKRNDVDVEYATTETN
jgi:hypothetical protein